MKEWVATVVGVLEPALTELDLQIPQFLILLLDLHGQMIILILQKLNLGDQLPHLHPMLLPRILQGSHSNVLPTHQILHIPIGTPLLLR